MFHLPGFCFYFLLYSFTVMAILRTPASLLLHRYLTVQFFRSALHGDHGRPFSDSLYNTFGIYRSDPAIRGTEKNLFVAVIRHGHCLDRICFSTKYGFCFGHAGHLCGPYCGSIVQKTEPIFLCVSLRSRTLFSGNDKSFIFSIIEIIADRFFFYHCFTVEDRNLFHCQAIIKSMASDLFHTGRYCNIPQFSTITEYTVPDLCKLLRQRHLSEICTKRKRTFTNNRNTVRKAYSCQTAMPKGRSFYPGNALFSASYPPQITIPVIFSHFPE